MHDAQQRIAAAAVRYGRAWGRPVGNASDARAVVQLGGQLIAFGNDFWAVKEHLANCAAELDSILS
jgi:2-keto-3-deoxy-L-rhamnonate aldolase RhmA